MFGLVWILGALVFPGVDGGPGDRSQEAAIDDTPGFIASAEAGDFAQVKSLVASGTDINVQDWAGRTALVAAASHGHADLVRFLLAAGANVQAGTEDSALIAAAKSDDLESMKLLLDAGAAVNAWGETRESGPETSLMFAAEHCNAPAVRLLVAHGADAKARIPFLGFTAIHLAVGSCRQEAS